MSTTPTSKPVRPTSHDFAVQLQAIAVILLNRPAFPTDSPFIHLHANNKEEMVAAVRALGSGEKDTSGTFFNFIPNVFKPTGLRVEIYVYKHEICRKVQEEIWECDPLLVPEQEGQLP